MEREGEKSERTLTLTSSSQVEGGCDAAATLWGRSWREFLVGHGESLLARSSNTTCPGCVSETVQVFFACCSSFQVGSAIGYQVKAKGHISDSRAMSRGVLIIVHQLNCIRCVFCGPSLGRMRRGVFRYRSEEANPVTLLSKRTRLCARLGFRTAHLAGELCPKSFETGFASLYGARPRARPSSCSFLRSLTAARKKTSRAMIPKVGRIYKSGIVHISCVSQISFVIPTTNIKQLNSFHF